MCWGQTFSSVWKCQPKQENKISDLESNNEMPFTAETRRYLEYKEEERLQIETEQAERKRGRENFCENCISLLVVC